ncbi:MAG: redoxin family protein [Phycisphaerales bacterium]
MKRFSSVAAFLAAGLAVSGVAMAAMNLNPEKDAKQAAKQADKKVASKAVVGETAPNFTLKDLDGKDVNLAEIGKDKVVVLEWFNPECPFVVKHHKKNPTFANLYKEFSPKGVVFLAINSGAAGKEGAGLDKSKEGKKEFGIQYPVLLDEAGDVGRTYGAKTTPHMFVIAKDGTIAYAGAIDNNTDAGKAGDINYVKNALDEVLAGKAVTTKETKPYGCSVKYGKAS